MRLGPDLILKTPATAALVKISTLETGNTFGAVYWTDGKREAPMLPERHWLLKAPATGELFWEDECEEVAQAEVFTEYQEVPYAADPGADDFLSALASGFASTPEKERYVRVQLWWLADDPVREGKADAPDAPWFCDNLTALIALLTDDDPSDWLMAAEAFRQLGEFDAAAERLNHDFPEEYEEAAECIRRLIEQRSKVVAQLA